MEGIGEAGRVFQTEGYDLPDFPVSDGNSGVNLNIKNIGMPSGVTICASFNKELSEAIGCVIGEEAKALGMPLVLAPAFNIHRNPLNGRQPEYFRKIRICPVSWPDFMQRIGRSRDRKLL